MFVGRVVLQKYVTRKTLLQILLNYTKISRFMVFKEMQRLVVEMLTGTDTAAENTSYKDGSFPAVDSFSGAER